MNPYLFLRPSLVLLTATVAPVLLSVRPEACAADDSAPAAHVYEQQLYGASRAPGLRVDADANAIVNRFRAGYRKLGSPRFLIYVNRDLVDTRSGFKLAGREETVVSNQREASRDLAPAPATESEAAAGSTSQTPSGRGAVDAAVSTSSSSGAGGPGGRAGDGAESTAATRAAVSSLDKKLAVVNHYERVDREEDSFEYRRLAREIEQAFGRRLRSAGAALADQKVATALIADRPLRDFVTPTEGEQARKDRDALARVADVVIEILIANRDVTVSRVSGTATRLQPEIHATAIRLSDARVMGQAISSDAGGSSPERSQTLRLGSRAVADATALQLMDDMLLGVQP